MQETKLFGHVLSFSYRKNGYFTNTELWMHKFIHNQIVYTLRLSNGKLIGRLLEAVSKIIDLNYEDVSLHIGGENIIVMVD